MINGRRIFVTVLAIALTVGCSPSEFDVIELGDLRERWDDSAKNSAVSWWYAGEDESFYYLVEKWPLETRNHRVSKDSVTIRGHERRAATQIEDEWSNLKASDVVFAPDAPQ